VSLLISPKEVDQQAVQRTTGMRICTLPAVGLSGGQRIAFIRGFVASYRAARKLFKADRPDAVLAMGGFTSAPPVLAGKSFGAQTFLHESNTIPGRANRWLSRIVDQTFVGFPQTASRFKTRNMTITGTPVRARFRARDANACRAALQLAPDRPVLLVMGGSQGATGVNNLMIEALPLLAKLVPALQYFHIAGPNDARAVKEIYSSLHLAATVHSFFAEMDLALGAATVAVSRAGASSLAELAAMRLPAVLIPFPAATGNHQFHNARAFEETSAALLVEEKSARPERFAEMISGMIADASERERMRAALGRWDAPRAAEEIAERMLSVIAKAREARANKSEPSSPGSQRHTAAVA
jgi:UDP-N-acetylglucosamine--N-acetylmuramyl-(pentapeptide) pyrophosphoryl-undecaprenol N-acetylglucosamine transferase